MLEFGAVIPMEVPSYTFGMWYQTYIQNYVI